MARKSRRTACGSCWQCIGIVGLLLILGGGASLLFVALVALVLSLLRCGCCSACWLRCHGGRGFIQNERAQSVGEVSRLEEGAFQVPGVPPVKPLGRSASHCVASRGGTTVFLNTPINGLLLPGDVIQVRTSGSGSLTRLSMTCTEDYCIQFETNNLRERRRELGRQKVFYTVTTHTLRDSFEHYAITAAARGDSGSISVPFGAPPTFEHPNLEGGPHVGTLAIGGSPTQTSTSWGPTWYTAYFHGCHCSDDMDAAGAVVHVLRVETSAGVFSFPIRVGSSPRTTSTTSTAASSPFYVGFNDLPVFLGGCRPCNTRPLGAFEASIGMPHNTVLRGSERAAPWFYPSYASRLWSVIGGMRDGAPLSGEPVLPPVTARIVCVISLAPGVLDEGYDELAHARRSLTACVAELELQGAANIASRSGTLVTLVDEHGAPMAADARTWSMSFGFDPHELCATRFLDLPLTLPPSIASRFFRVNYHLEVTHAPRAGLCGAGSTGRSLMSRLQLWLTDNPEDVPLTPPRRRIKNPKSRKEEIPLGATAGLPPPVDSENKDSAVHTGADKLSSGPVSSTSAEEV